MSFQFVTVLNSLSFIARHYARLFLCLRASSTRSTYLLHANLGGRPIFHPNPDDDDDDDDDNLIESIPNT